METMEKWKNIKGYEGKYEVSNCGRVRSLNYRRSGEVKELKPGTDGFGYKFVLLSTNGKPRMKKVHRLVYEAFRGPIPAGMEINHLDENPANNWLENLETCTRKENNNYGSHNERVAKANGKPVQQIDRVTGEVLNIFPSVREAGRQTGINPSHIASCCKGKPWYKSAGGYKWRYANNI